MILTPIFFTTLIAFNTSSDSSKLKILDLPTAIEDNNIHLILILLSLDTKIFPLKGLIVFLI